MTATRKRKTVGAFKKLKSLGKDRMADIDARLLSGESSASIVHYIHDDWKALRDSSFTSLVKMINRYRESELRTKTLERMANLQSGNSLKVMHRQVNVREELELVVGQQRKRVDGLLLREGKLPEGMILKDTSNEMRLLKDTLMDLFKMQIETGVLLRAPRPLMPGNPNEAPEQVEDFSWGKAQEELAQTLKEIEEHGEDEEDE